MRMQRSIQEPIRNLGTTAERWEGPDRGLIWCWERGRQKRVEQPDLAARAEAGELIVLAWEGGVEKKLKVEEKLGALKYLATWQGLRGEDLDVEPEGERVIVCAKTRQAVVFSAELPEEEA